jgi:cyclomaltodextrinase / maltogenic alpha-amylase / neopullulanase
MTIKTPDWVKNAIFYHIFPDRFAKTEQDRRGLIRSTNIEPWEAHPTLHGYKGGDLWGVIEKLDYLQDLGINAIYLTPIFQSASNHRYHTHDYYQVDPMLGGNSALDALIEAAHQRDIKIVLDGVFNHVGRGFFFFNDILEHGPHSPWLSWFHIEDWPLSAYDGSKPANYLGWVGNRALPQFNHSNPQVREYIMQVAEYWLKKGIDGWRLDVPFEIKEPGFWQEFRDRVKAINPEAYIVGEVWHDSREWLDGTQFDAVMNYLFPVATIAFTAGDRVLKEYLISDDYAPYPALSAREYANKIEELLSLYDWQIQLVQYNLLDSHDTTRMLTLVGEDRSSVELATVLMFTFPGAPSIYYGNEVGLPGGIDPDCRRAFPAEIDWDLDVLDSYKRLISLRNQYPALRTGAYRVLYADETVYVFSRVLETQEVIVAVNIDTTATEINFTVKDLQSYPQKTLYGEGKIVRSDRNTTQPSDREESYLTLNLSPRSACIFY